MSIFYASIMKMGSFVLVSVANHRLKSNVWQDADGSTWFLNFCKHHRNRNKIKIYVHYYLKLSSFNIQFPPQIKYVSPLLWSIC